MQNENITPKRKGSLALTILKTAIGVLTGLLLVLVTLCLTAIII